ncbi:MAG: DUF4157 domain-containing protein [Aequorivita sp.]
MYSPLLKNTSESKQSYGRMRPVVQPKLTVNRPGDIYEQEADAMADRVMRMSADETFRQPQPATGLIGRSVQRKCSKCEEEEKKKPIMRKAENGATGIPVSSSFASSLNASKGGGSPLPKDTRSFMEKAFSSDFSSVRIHNDDRASEMSRGISAKAFTTGNDIYFNKGQYNPGSAKGKHLLAHELTHTLQQDGAKTKEKTIQRRVIDSNVVTNAAMLTQLGLTRQEVIDNITNADAEAIQLAIAAEQTLSNQLANAQAGNAVDANSELILNEELGLSFNNAGQRGLIIQQRGRFRKVRETLESGYLRYMALGIGNVSLVSCKSGNCTNAFAFSCPGNRLIVLCQAYWDEASEQSSTILHEPFHIWFHMANHTNNTLRRADASCLESFALRAVGRVAPASCDTHTAG